MTFETVFVFPNLLALVIIIAGGLVRGYAGFGSGLVMVPLLAFLWDPVNAIILTLSLGLFATIQMTYPALKLANWTNIAPMIFAAIFVTPIGTLLLINLNPDLI
ncbi:MAG: TSUP family transporter, partial [Candidatus Marinimicrobia bacterium]|nr:TSUP family transporter [Candidatus Neomarinimicrobiota bacterium]